MRQSKSVSRLLMGSILSAMLAGLVPVVYAQEGSGGAGAGGGGAAGGLPPAAGRQDLEPWAPRVLRQARARVRRPTDRWGGQATNPVPNTPPSTGHYE
jgi:hypothetical protein